PEEIIGGRQSLAVYAERSHLIRENDAFRGRVARLLAKQYEDQPKAEFVEQKIYDGLPTRADEVVMSRFHLAGWPERVPIIGELEDSRYRQFGRRVLATERLDLLSAIVEPSIVGDTYPVVARPELVSDWEKVFYSALVKAGVRPLVQYDTD